MLQKILLCLFFSSFHFSFLAIAAEANEPYSSISEAEVKSKPVDIDDDITNAKLRAESGAKKKYFLRSSLTYNGGPISQPLSELSPDLNTFNPNLQVSTLLFGSLGASYRLNESDNLSLSGSLGIRQPFQSHTNRDFAKEFNLLNPTLTWSKATFSTVQMFTSVSATRLTSESSQTSGSLGSLDVSQTLLHSLIVIPIDIGLTISAGTTFFKDLASQFCVAGYGQPICFPRRDAYMSLLPYFEYRISDRLSINTSLNAFYFYHTKNDALVFNREGIAVQTFGLGYALTRDIYISPYVQFVPQVLRAARTITTISATINL